MTSPDPTERTPTPGWPADTTSNPADPSRPTTPAGSDKPETGPSDWPPSTGASSSGAPSGPAAADWGGPADAGTPPAERPASAWREPAWIPPKTAARGDRGGNASLIFGVIILIIGLWFFASRTLGLDLPDLDWRQLWPLLLIGLGAWIVLGSVRRSR